MWTSPRVFIFDNTDKFRNWHRLILIGFSGIRTSYEHLSILTHWVLPISDISKDNIWFDSYDYELLSDFGASCSFEYPNPSVYSHKWTFWDSLRCNRSTRNSFNDIWVRKWNFVPKYRSMMLKGKCRPDAYLARRENCVNRVNQYSTVPLLQEFLPVESTEFHIRMCIFIST